jgi:hypothetical protein
MRLSMISRIIQTEVNVICRSEAEADNIDRGLNNKQLLNEAEHYIKNYSDRGQCYLPKRS